MSTSDVGKVVQIVQNFVPTTFGVKNAYYKVEGNKIEVTYLVKEESASDLIGYLNSLSNIIESEVPNVRVESGIYVYRNEKRTESLADTENLNPITLRSFNYALR